MKTPSLLSVLLASLLALVAVTTTFAAPYIDPMDTTGPGYWELGGGSNANPKSLTVDTTIYSQGTSSLNATATYNSGGSAYADVFRNFSTPLDLSTNTTFNVDIRSTVAWSDGMYVNWQLLTVTHGTYEVTYKPASANAWYTASYTMSDFTLDSSNLTDVNYIRFRIIGDALATLPQTVSTNFDNMQIVPEPSAGLLTLLAIGGIALLKFRRLRQS